jgi:hypothetical protein
VKLGSSPKATPTERWFAIGFQVNSCEPKPKRASVKRMVLAIETFAPTSC